VLRLPPVQLPARADFPGGCRIGYHWLCAGRGRGMDGLRARRRGTSWKRGAAGTAAVGLSGGRVFDSGWADPAPRALVAATCIAPVPTLGETCRPSLDRNQRVCPVQSAGRLCRVCCQRVWNGLFARCRLYLAGAGDGALAAPGEAQAGDPDRTVVPDERPLFVAAIPPARRDCLP